MTLDIHRWTSLDGTPIRTIDTKLYRRDQARKSIARSIKNILRRLVLPHSMTTVMLVIALPVLAQLHV
jgi:hypothetical protein